MKRYRRLDEIRGFTIISMILYHMMWDLVYIFDFPVEWYRTTAGYIWQQSICWTFILLSGFCFPLGRRKLRRGLFVFFSGLLVMAVTNIFVPEERVVFGVLTLLGSCMLLLIPLDSLFQMLSARQTSGFSMELTGLIVCMLFFLSFRNINMGYGGFEALRTFEMPEALYRDLFTTYLGFPYPEFFSTDYFSLIPWFFLFRAGYFLHGVIKKQNCLSMLLKGSFYPIEWLGRHSIWIYLLHQPAIMLVLRLLF